MNNTLYEYRNWIVGYLAKVLHPAVVVFFCVILDACSKSYSSKPSQQHSLNTEYRQKALGKADIDASLKRSMSKLRRNLPAEKIERFGEVTMPIDVNMDDDYFYYIDEIDDAKSRFFSYDAQTRKEIHREYLITMIPSMKALLLQLIDTDRGIVFRFVASSSGAVKDIVYTKEELQGMLANSELLVR